MEKPVLVTGNGTCGVNGNSKRFGADQSGESCDGSIEGVFAGFFDTFTTLEGKDNAVLYQVFLPEENGGNLVQSQLTTMTGSGRRTRSAQGFSASIPTYSSFYRERRVTEEEFYEALEETLIEYNILEEDTCTRDRRGNLIDGIVGGIDACRAHLEESFALGSE